MNMNNKVIGVVIAVTQSKWIRSALIALALGLAAFNLTGCKKSEPATSENAAVKYTCPMHPEVVKDAPGNCPKCGMKLVAKHQLIRANKTLAVILAADNNKTKESNRT